MKKLLPIQDTLNCNGKALDLAEPKVMSILNVTPDSFYDGGVRKSTQEFVDLAGESIEAGAAILDVGGVSTRPGAKEVGWQEELDRVAPVLSALNATFPQVVISLDTWQSKVLEAAAELGVDMVNDISGGQFDDQMWSMVAKLKLPYILMHTKGRPKDMQSKTTYQNVSIDLCDYFSKTIPILRDLDIIDIIIDPGFGFGKTVPQNYQLLRELEGFRILGCPLLIGISRKSMIYKPLEIKATQALNATSALHMLALQNGANILRVHDTKEAMQCIKLFNLYSENN